MNAFLQFTVVGIAVGCIYALTATGLVVTYTTSGIFNFAHGALGMIAAFAYWHVSVEWGWPVPIALLLVLGVFSPLMGAVIERTLMRKLHGASTGTGLVVSLGLLLALVGLAQIVWDPNTARVTPEFFAGSQVELFGVGVRYHQLITLAVTLAVAIGLKVFFSQTRTGIAMRAVVDDPDLMSMTGASPARVAMLSWALGSALAGLAGILLAPTVSLDVLILTLLVVSGYAAAMVGRLKSLPLTFAGGIGLGVFEQQVLGQWFDVFNPIRQAIPIMFLFALLLLLPQARLRAGRLSAGYIPRIPSLRTTVVAGIVFVAGTWVVSGILEGKSVAYAGRGLVLAIIMLSLVLLTGFGGQVSLCQLTFAGLGAFAMGKVAGGASPLGLVAAVVLAGAVGALVALPALRLQGLYLALSTLAFAVATSEILFKNEIAFGYGSDLPIGRIPGTSSDRGFLAFCAIVFAVAAVGILALRRAHFGRRLAAMGDSPAACATIGMNLTSTKLVVFGLSAGLAGLGGALFGSFRGSVGQTDFDMFQSLVLLLLISIMGIRNVTAALLAGLTFSLLPLVTDAIPDIQSAPFLFAGVGAIVVGRKPAGVIGDMAHRFNTWQQRSRTAGAPSASARPVRTGVESLAGAGR